MPTRKELKGIAAGLYGSFINRNNDVDGYWGIGKLRLHADQNKSSHVVINLLDETINPPTKDFCQLLKSYHKFLKQHIIARNLPPDWLFGASIDLFFDAPPPEGRTPCRATYGSLFKLTVTLIDDRNKNHIITGYGYCAPHDPNLESRSSKFCNVSQTQNGLFNPDKLIKHLFALIKKLLSI